MTKAAAKVTTESGSKTYDGTALTAGASISGLAGGESVTLSATGSQKDVGSSNNTYSLTWSGADADNYELTESIGTLTITPKAALVTTGSATKAYDGMALTSTEASIEGLVEGETATVTVIGSQTDAGSSVNTYTIDWGTTNKDNYTISENLGTLKVLAAGPSDSPNDDSSDYDKGYYAGFWRGWADAGDGTFDNDISEEWSNDYKEGYRKGYAEGYENGYYTKQYDIGNEAGKAAGSNDRANENAYNPSCVGSSGEGYYDGYMAGYDEGYSGGVNPSGSIRNQQPVQFLKRQPIPRFYQGKRWQAICSENMRASKPAQPAKRFLPRIRGGTLPYPYTA